MAMICMMGVTLMRKKKGSREIVNLEPKLELVQNFINYKDSKYANLNLDSTKLKTKEDVNINIVVKDDTSTKASKPAVTPILKVIYNCCPDTLYLIQFLKANSWKYCRKIFNLKHFQKVVGNFLVIYII